MSVAALAFTSTSPLSIDADVLVLGVHPGDSVRLAEIDGVDSPELARLADSLEAIGVTGKRDQVVRIPSPEGVVARSVALVGLGAGEADVESLRYAAGAAARQLRGVATVAFALPVADDAQAAAVLEGAAVGAYAYLDYRVDSLRDSDRAASSMLVAAAPGRAAEIVAEVTARATAAHTVRDLVNTPPNDLYPSSFADRAVELAAGLDVEITVLDETALAEGGYGGLLAVGAGSVRPPRLVKVSWAPAAAKTHLALVGKGITFDTGGLTLKPPASMLGMKYDMTGAATVLAATLAAAALDLPVRITAWLCLAENMPSGSAGRPGDVFAVRGGTTVENLNSDAEGRLVLADGLVAAAEENPDAIIDVATLTGAASVALGTRYVAAMGSDELVAATTDAASAVGEQVWQMPLPGDLRALLNSDVADIANVRPGNTAGGMLLAGVFLKEFIGKREDGSQIPWTHLDIAGAANNSGGPWGWTGKGPTAVMTRTLIELADRLASGETVITK